MTTTLKCGVAVVAAAWLALAPGAGFAQASAPGDLGAEKLALAKQIVIASDAQGNMRRMVQAMSNGFSQGNTLMGDPDIKRIMDQLMREEMSTMTDKALPLIAGVYADTFDVQDLRTLLAFYQSPTGHKLVEMQPEVAERTQVAIKPLIAPMQRDMLVKMFSRICAAKHCNADQQKAMQQAEKQILERLDAQSRGEPTT